MIKQKMASYKYWLLADKSILVLIFIALVAYNGVVLLGLAMDDYFNMEVYSQFPLGSLLTWQEYNRAPVFFLVIYPFLLWWPEWVSHILVIVVHTISAILLNKLLEWFTLGNLISIISASVFLIWPAHYEVLFWSAASASAFGVFFILTAVWSLVRDKLALAVILSILGMLCTESVIIPSIFLLGIVSIHKKSGVLSTSLFILSILGGYGIYQLLRLALMMRAGRFSSLTPYATVFSVDRALGNIVELFWISLGLGSSRDISWIWIYADKPVDVGVLLAETFLIPAFIIASLIIISFNGKAQSQALKTQFRIVSFGVICAGYISATLIFLPLSISMQSRYTYTGIIFLSVLFAVAIETLFASRLRLGVYLGILALSLLGGYSIYKSWSNIWVNWRVAYQVSERIISDIDITYQETGARQIFLVNEPKGVGNAFALSRDWAYRAAGHLYVDPELSVEADVLYQYASDQANMIGTKFADAPCVFISWHDGKRVVATKILSESGTSILNCDTGYIEEASKQASVEHMIRFKTAGSKEHFAEFQAR